MTPTSPTLDTLDAMTITLVLTEAFCSIDLHDLPHMQARGALLLYDAVLRRVKPLLPNTPEMAHIFQTINTCERVAAQIRELAGMPAVL